MTTREESGSPPLSSTEVKLQQLSLNSSSTSLSSHLSSKSDKNRYSDTTISQKPDAVDNEGTLPPSATPASYSDRPMIRSTSTTSQNSIQRGPPQQQRQQQQQQQQPNMMMTPSHNGYSPYRHPPPQAYYDPQQRPSPQQHTAIGAPPAPPPPMSNGGAKYYYPSVAGTPRPQYAPSPQLGYQPLQQQQPPLQQQQQQYGRPQMMMMTQPYAAPIQQQPLIDNNYMPDSSVLAASQAGRRMKQSPFPPPSMENLQQFRAEAQSSNDPKKMLDLAKYMMEVVPAVCAANEKDPKRARKIKDALTAEAQKIVKKLASSSGLGKSGYPEAIFYLADCYGSGKLGLAVDVDKAFSLYLQGSKLSHPACTYRVAVCYEVGAGTKKDNAHAIQFFRKAANLGDGKAMYKLSMILLRGTLGQPRNPREGMSWLERAATQADEDHPQPIHDLGVAFEKEGIPSVIPDPNYARDLFTRAAQYGYAPSQFKLGLAYENGFLGCPIDPRRSIAWYSKAAEQGDLESELALSGWYLTGAEGGILAQNDVEAYLWAKKAADRGYAKAEYAVGYYTETGVGVKQSLDDARKWYMRAAAQNNRRAMQRLTELKKHGSMQQRRKHTRENGVGPNEKDSDCTIM